MNKVKKAALVLSFKVCDSSGLQENVFGLGFRYVDLKIIQLVEKGLNLVVVVLGDLGGSVARQKRNCVVGAGVKHNLDVLKFLRIEVSRQTRVGK